MLTLLLKRIWKDRAANGWLFAGLFIVFIILWYVIDFLFATLYVSHEQKGYDTQHVYQVDIDTNPVIIGEYKGAEVRMESFLQVYRLIKEYPGVESASYYAGTIPYDKDGGMFQAYTVDSVRSFQAYIRMVNSGFFDVFKVNIEQGDLSGWDISGPRIPAVVSKDLADSLFQGNQKPGSLFIDYYDPGKKYKIAAITPRIKQSEYERYGPFIHTPMENRVIEYMTPVIAIRVNPDKEKGFIDRFTADMRDKLTIGPYYFSRIHAYNEARDIHDTNINNYIRTSVAVLLFFVFNVFLGIIGTFWFRTRKRRGEIGLKLAVGASRRKVSNELFLECFYILLMVALPAFIVCLNIWWLDLTVNTLMDPSLSRFLLTICVTFLLMLAMVIAGVWYPSRQAMQVLPAEALHDE